MTHWRGSRSLDRAWLKAFTNNRRQRTETGAVAVHAVRQQTLGDGDGTPSVQSSREYYRLSVTAGRYRHKSFAGGSVDGDTQESPESSRGPGVLAIPKGPNGVGRVGIQFPKVWAGCGMPATRTTSIPTEKVSGSSPDRQRSLPRISGRRRGNPAKRGVLVCSQRGRE